MESMMGRYGVVASVEICEKTEMSLEVTVAYTSNSRVS